jgi:hypothetical protein
MDIGVLGTCIVLQPQTQPVIAEGKTWLAYNDPKYIVQRDAVEGNLSANLAGVIPLLERTVPQYQGSSHS